MAVIILTMKLFMFLSVILIANSKTIAKNSNEENLSLKQGEYTKTIKMKNAKSSRPDDLQCTYMKMNSTRRQYITGYIPRATKHTAHHMVIYGCKKPAYLMENEDAEPNWYCGPNSVGVCEQAETYSSDNIVYAWALNAEGFDFPDGAGFRIGGDTDFQYLVLQMHYKYAFSNSEVDNSGVTLKLTDTQLSKQVGYYIMGNTGYIPPRLPEYHMESGCKFDLPFEIIPFRYRTHAHNLGRVISGYVIKPNSTWYEIGRMSPQQPQLFYHTNIQNFTIQNDDVMVSRCTMNSMDRDGPTIMGPRNADEMCNFYVMFYTSYKENIQNIYCFRDSQRFSWQKASNSTTFPENASNLNGVTLLEPENELHIGMNHE